MTHFNESAVRDSAEQHHGLTLPYWLPNNQVSALIHATHLLDDHGVPPVDSSQYVDSSTLPTFTDESISMPPEFNLLPAQRPIPYSQYGEYAPPAVHGASQRPGRAASSASSLTPSSPRTAVKTPTGSRTLRRPGLAGASALVNGHYCCQWHLNGLACGRLFTNARQLNDHIKTDHVRGAQIFVCNWQGCDKDSFPTANKLVRHVHSHTGYKPFQCQSCPQSFVTKDQLDKHSTTHTGAKDFVCPWEGCDRSFAVKHALDGHINSVHLKAKKHTCPHCAQAFDDSSNLSKHKKQVHNQETGIRCPARHTHNCAYVDSRKDKMKEHCEREQHGLEYVNDPQRWNLWVQQFKSAARKSDARRQCRHVPASPMSCTSGASNPVFAPLSRTSVLPIECNKEDCNLPVCLPCNMLCSDLHQAALHHPLIQPCTQPDCEEPCSPSCDPCEPCEPCESCDDADCDPATRQPCTSQPCTAPHCGSASPSPSRLITPPPYEHDTIPSDTYFPFPAFAGADGDPFQEPESSYQFGAGRASELFRL